MNSAIRKRKPPLSRRSEAGFAMPTAVIILFITTLLLAAAVKVASQTSTSTTRDSNVKAEIEAADGGLQVATYRLSQLEPKSTQCINGAEALTATTVAEAEAKCKSAVESLGNNATFQYWTSLPLPQKAGEKCAGETVVTKVGTIQRCITSEGLVNGVQPGVRLQTSTAAPVLFSVNGLLGTESVELNNNAKVSAKTATNGKLNVGNGATTESVLLGASAPAGQPEGGGTWGTVTREAANFTVPAVNPGTSATENSNFRIENGINKTLPADPSTGVEYNKETRTVTMGNKATLTLGGPVYNFCNFTTGTGVTITLVAGVTTKIYIDSPNDPGSKCKAGDGKLIIGNNSAIINPSKEAAKFQIYVYDESGGPVEFNNNAVVGFYGTLYAPNSVVKIKNNDEFTGAVAAKSVVLSNNGTFKTEKAVEELIAGRFSRKTWEQCTSGSGASAGC
jgi:Tfp pilus assembly protein PilX